MLPQKTRHLLYVVLLVFISIFGSTVLAKTGVNGILTKVVSSFTETVAEAKATVNATQATKETSDDVFITSTAMFATIIIGANEEVVCPNDGSTLAKFFLCGTSDVRTISLSQSGST
ncbi:MAG: hypothetical protein VXW38_14345, partial [Bacteroidota bacterium]|nr:hypothetical protein [Bacteroidota bacterium]